jgi:hypothetical protein
MSTKHKPRSRRAHRAAAPRAARTERARPATKSSKPAPRAAAKPSKPVARAADERVAASELPERRPAPSAPPRTRQSLLQRARVRLRTILRRAIAFY